MAFLTPNLYLLSQTSLAAFLPGGPVWWLIELAPTWASPRAETGLEKGGGDSLGALGNLGHTAVCLFDPLHLLHDC